MQGGCKEDPRRKKAAIHFIAQAVMRRCPLRLDADSNCLVARRITSLGARVAPYGAGSKRRSPAPFSFAAGLASGAAA
jgi:hypothetical protein